jgi:hypothetical protein
MIESKVTVIIPFKHNIQWLDLCTKMWLSQEPRDEITLHVLDTENILLSTYNDNEYNVNWIFTHPRIEVAHLGLAQGKHHPSDPVAIAYDFSFSRCLSAYALTTHIDVFPKHRGVVKHMLGIASMGHPVVGWETSKRGFPAQMLKCFLDQSISPLPNDLMDIYNAMPSPSDGTIGMVCSLFNIQTVDKAGLAWSVRKCHHMFDTSRGATDAYGWPDTETISKYIFDKAGITPMFLGRETNFENQETEHWIHSRSMTLDMLPRHHEAFNKAKAIYESWK